jgi:homogentisate 1,2-dioxygenase
MQGARTRVSFHEYDPDEGAVSELDALVYQSGFGNEFATEALPGALPDGRNSPQNCPYSLYAEQFSGSAFTAPRHASRRSWLYRIRPAVTHAAFHSRESDVFADSVAEVPSPNQLRWDPLPLPATPTDFVDGLVPVAGNGSPEIHSGCGIYLYAANQSMRNRFFYSADGELLIVPQLGTLTLDTELGRLQIEPQEIAVIPRGLRFRADVQVGAVRGYICENFGAPFRLPELGPIGANGLANPRDFRIPSARYEDLDGRFELIAKFQGRLWTAQMDHSPLDVVAWHGNNAPYKYDLRRFNTMGSVSYDHPDPSIFSVLHSPSDTPGTGNLDFVVFPPRWLAMENTFRPPWFHRNVASEYMGLIHGLYDAKSTGFVPGGASLHNCMSGHGPDAATFAKALAVDTSAPTHITDTMAFMFESRLVIKPTRAAMQGRPPLQKDYMRYWLELKKRFDPGRR